MSQIILGHDLTDIAVTDFGGNVLTTHGVANAGDRLTFEPIGSTDSHVCVRTLFAGALCLATISRDDIDSYTDNTGQFYPVNIR